MTYTIAWSIYALGCLLFVGGGMLLTRGLRPLPLRDLLWLLIIGSLVPWATSVSFEGYWAPAFVVLVFEGLFQPEGDLAGALAALVVGWGLALGAWLLVTVTRLLLRRGSAP